MVCNRLSVLRAFRNCDCSWPSLRLADALARRLVNQSASLLCSMTRSRAVWTAALATAAACAISFFSSACSDSACLTAFNADCVCLFACSVMVSHLAKSRLSASSQGAANRNQNEGNLSHASFASAPQNQFSFNNIYIQRSPGSFLKKGRLVGGISNRWGETL